MYQILTSLITAKLGVVTKEQDDDSISSLAASVTEPPKEQSTNLIPSDRFSSYQKLLRVTAYVLRLSSSQESYRTVDGSVADPVKLDEAERHLQYLVQGESFIIERKDLLGNKFVKKSSRFSQYTPFFGPHGLTRSSGRLRWLVEIDFDTKHPIVLDARHNFVKLFLRHTHLRTHHQDIDYLRSKVQEHYAILNYVPHCVPSNQTASCAENSVQQPFNLSWQTSQRRDSHTSLLPLPTPVLVISAHSMSQFVELQRRGGDFSSLVSLLVLSMLKSSLPWTLVLCNGSGVVRLPWSDNGTNFSGVEQELRECMEKWNTLNIAAQVAHKGIRWRFNPPNAPHQGGIWERLVRSFKRVLHSRYTPPHR